MAMFQSFLEMENAPLTILDIGGSPEIWRFVEQSLSITILNLPGRVKHEPSHHHIRYVEGDACNMDFFKDKEFDLAFSNSVIEHVGSVDNQKAFAREAQRVARMLWIQTPCRYFPLEPHTGMPFWWFYPRILKDFFLARWRKKLPAWTEYIEGTTVLSKKELKDLFPRSQIHTEPFLFLSKSYLVTQGFLKTGRYVDKP